MKRFMEIGEGPERELLHRLMRAFHRLDKGLTENPEVPLCHVNDVVTQRAWQRTEYRERALTAMAALGIDSGPMFETVAKALAGRVMTELDIGKARERLAGAHYYRAHTDGSASYKAGNGGWGVVVEAFWHEEGDADPYNTRTVEMMGGDPHSTNNRMEMSAVMTALKLVPRGAKIEIVTDSEYVMKGATLWLRGWKANDWFTGTGKRVSNCDLWQRLDLLIERRAVHWKWVKGHTGIEGNERADKLATLGRLNHFPTTINDPQPGAELDFQDGQAA